ncbi:50S ribosomal protein L29 [Patescibacteria group bacterium]|nr:50S ribosomal protein L29 [Patescibacteria group bacterium]
MKNKDKKALRELSVSDLNKKLSELELAFAKNQMEKKVGKTTDLRMGSKLADDIARVKTVIRAKEMEA